MPQMQDGTFLWRGEGAVGVEVRSEDVKHQHGVGTLAAFG